MARSSRARGCFSSDDGPGVEFIGRFLQHVLPKDLRHIRRFGFMGPRVHTEKLNQIRELMGIAARKEVQPPPPAMD